MQLMELTLHSENFIEELEQIELSNTNIIRKANLSIALCRKILLEFKKEIIRKGFGSIKEEVEFFKKTKQVPLIKLIYYSELRSFEMQFPKANISAQRKFIKKKLNKLNRFFLYNMDFGQYIVSGQTNLDEYYFTRKYFDAFPITSSKFYLQDPEFSTARGMLLGKFKAYGSLTIYLQKRLSNKRENNTENPLLSNGKMNLKWTGSYAAFIEMIYGCDAMDYFNNGNIEINTIIQELGSLLNVPIGNSSRTYNEIKNRKQSRIKFYEETGQKLLEKMNKEDGI